MIESGLIKQGFVKKGLIESLQSWAQRYFRRNEGTTDYATIPEVTLSGDFVIEFDMYRTDAGISGQFLLASYDTVAGSYGVNAYSSGNWGAGVGTVQLFSFSGSPLVTGLSPNIWYKIRFEYNSTTKNVKAFLNNVFVNEAVCTPPSGLTSANATTLYRAAQGGFVLNGILANLKIYDNGTLVRDYPLDDNSDTIRDLANGQNGTIINGNASDWGLFDRQANGDWLGQELVVNGGFDSDSDWTKGAGWSIAAGAASAISTSNVLTQNISDFINRSALINYEIVSISSGSNIKAQFGGVQTAGKGSVGKYSEVVIPTNSDPVLYLFGASITASLDNISVKEVLKNA